MDPVQRPLRLLSGGDHDDPGGRRGRPGRERLRLPDGARVTLQGGHLHESVPGPQRDHRHRHHGGHLIRAVPAEHLQDGPADAGRLGLPRRRRRHLVLRRRSEKMVPAPQRTPAASRRQPLQPGGRQPDEGDHRRLRPRRSVHRGQPGPAGSRGGRDRQGPAGVPAAAPRLQRPHHQGVRVRP